MFAAAIATIDSFSVIDPCNRTGKIMIPSSFVSETKGVFDFVKAGCAPPPDVKDLSLCLLFQKGRCNAGTRCNQVHAAPEFIAELRRRASTVRSCCARHGDVHSTQLDGHRTVVVQTPDGESSYALCDFAWTPSLETALKRARVGQPARIQASRICRLHQRSTCKFGRDCKNVHLCRDAVSLSSEAAAPAKAVSVRVSPVAQPPALGLAFRAVDTVVRCEAPCVEDSYALPGAGSANTSVTDFGAIAADPSAASSTAVPPLNPMSVLSVMTEFNFTRPSDEDPLDLAEHDSASSVSADFEDFVDALVRCDPEPMPSPQWLATA